MITNVTAIQMAQSEPARHVQISAQMEDAVLRNVKKFAKLYWMTEESHMKFVP